MPSDRQIGIKGEREPELCAVTGRDVVGKHAVTHYGPDGQYVYVLAQVDHLWPQAAPVYGFPVPEENSAQDENVFVLELDEEGQVIVPTGDNGVGSQFLLSSESPRLVQDPPAPRQRRPTVVIDPNDTSKGDD